MTIPLFSVERGCFIKLIFFCWVVYVLSALSKKSNKRFFFKDYKNIVGSLKRGTYFIYNAFGKQKSNDFTKRFENNYLMFIVIWRSHRSTCISSISLPFFEFIKYYVLWCLLLYYWLNLSYTNIVDLYECIV